jgi:hypothetical protein
MLRSLVLITFAMAAHILSTTEAFLIFRNKSPVTARLAYISDLDSKIWTRDQLNDYASTEGIVLSISTLGPNYRVLARAKHNTTIILGYCEGFIRPGGLILHLDKMEIFRKTIQRSFRENPEEFRGGGTLLGVGQLIGYLCLLHGREKGCRTGEFLAIDDEYNQHRKLVQYYKRSGFKIIKYVGDEFSHIPDRLVWGGRGTLMREDIIILLEKWTQSFAKSSRV